MIIDGQPAEASDGAWIEVRSPATGALAGTLAYAAPEIVAGRRGDARADVYALGLTLYFALTGTLPGRPASTTRVAAVRTGAPRSDTLSITRKSARMVVGVAVHDTYPRRLP